MKQKLTSAFGLLALVFLLGKCAYSVGYPYTCDQAKVAFLEAQRKVDSAMSKATIVDASDADLQRAIYDRSDAGKKAASKCHIPDTSP